MEKGVSSSLSSYCYCIGPTKPEA